MMNFFRRVTKNWLWTLLSLFSTLLIVFVIIFSYLELKLPNTEALKNVQLRVPMRIVTSDNKLIAEYGNERRIPVTLGEIPPNLVHAVIATEDKRYFEHPGVDFIGIVRAARAVLKSGQKVQGASTITMQVARNFFLTRKKTYGRKINEILLALKLDREFSKEKILELYLNKIYLGSRAYGVAAAAQVYYGKNLDQLTLAQIAMIAGLPQAPSADNPINNPVGAKNRRNHVLQRMLDSNFINQEQYQEATQQPITAKYHHRDIEVYAPYIAEMVRIQLVKKYGKERAYNDGITAYTTINSKDQAAATQSLRGGLIAYTNRHGYRGPIKNLGNNATPDNITTWLADIKKQPSYSPLQPAVVTNVNQQDVTAILKTGETITIKWPGLSWAAPAQAKGRTGPKPQQASDILHVGDVIEASSTGEKQNLTWQLSQIPKVQGALVSLNPNDGAILALTGGFAFNASKFNRAMQAQRQPGSNFKPFIYSAALAKGLTLATTINDAPIVLPDSGENKLWRPQNDTLKFYGPTRIRVGLAQSRNLVSIRLLQNIGIPYALDYAKRFGFNPNDLPHTLSLALGSGTTTPMQIASGYAVFANDGFQIAPYLIAKITDENSNILYVENPKMANLKNTDEEDTSTTEQAPRVIDAQNAFLMTHALQDVIKEGTGRRALSLKRSDIAGKTGTTNKQMDAWFSGFNGQVVTTVWVGFDDQTSLYEYGSKAALPIWINYMRTALAGTPISTLSQPPGIVSMRIDAKTGLLAPAGSPGIFEFFRKQYAPTNTAPSASTLPYNNDPTANTTPETSTPNEDNNSTGEIF